MATLRRAVSTTYYALFHCLARSSANLLIGGTGAKRSASAWNQVYRSLEHNPARNKCTNKEIMSRFPDEIQDFAVRFVDMQLKRASADYDPLIKFYKSAVIEDIDLAEKAIDDFNNAPSRDRRAFCAYVLFRDLRKA